MTSAHFHLMLNHLPVLGSLFGVALLGVAVRRKSAELTHAGLVTLVIAALAAIPAFLTGEGAEHAVEHLPGVGESLIERHADMAGVALAFLEIAGGLALATLILERVGRAHRALAPATLAVAAIASVLMGYTALLGGEIRHTEIRGGTAASAPASND